MKKTMRLAVVALLIVAVSVAGVLAYRYYVLPAPIKPLNVSVKIGQFPISLDHVARDYANQVILPQKYGVSVEPAHFSSGRPLIAALISGDVDIIGVALTEVNNAVAQGAKFKVFAVENAAAPYLLVAKKSISSMKDLERGASVGVSSIGGLTYVVAYIGLKASGVDVSKIQWVPLGGGKDRAKALAAGKVDAAPIVYDDLEAILAEAKDYHEIANLGKIIGPYLSVPLTARTDYVDSHPKVLQAVTSAYMEANRWALKNRDEFINFGLKVMPESSKQILSEAYPKMVASGIWNPNGGLSKSLWDRTLGFLADVKAVETKIPFEQGVATQFQEKSVSMLGAMEIVAPILMSTNLRDLYAELKF